MKQYLIKNKLFVVYLLIVIFYSVGVIGISNNDLRSYFLPLSWVVLFMSFLALVFTRETKGKSFFFFLLICYFISMLTEAIGVNTGLLFGTYEYGANLGFKIFGVPLIIGVNWTVLIISTAAFFNKLKNFWLRVILSSLLMVGIDFIMEPVAIKMDFWVWDGPIPFYNYICWFLTSLLIHIIYDLMKLNSSNNIPRFLFCILALFFIILNFV